MTQEIAVQERHPLLRVSEATLVARQLQSYIREARLSVRVGQSEHVRIEGWQFLCLVLGVPFPSIVEVQRSTDEQGNIVYSACAELCLPNSSTPHRAWALCSSAEPNWRGKPEYAILSMAQTRAAGKVLRLTLGWIMPMAGYSATPYEEMEGVMQVAPQPAPAPQRARTRRAPAREQQEPAQEPRQAEYPTAQAIADILRERMTPDEARELLREYYGVSRVSDLNDEQRAHLYRTLTEGGER